MTVVARLPRVILVEDDAAIRQFVTMAVEDLPMQLLGCPSLHSAREALRLTGDDLALVLLDMMLPDGSGLDLLRDPLRQRPELQARWVVFSAGMPPATRSLLGELGVTQVLDKPVPLDRLIACVESACADWRERRRTAPGPGVNRLSAAGPASADEPEPPASRAAPPPATTPLREATGSLRAQEAAALQQYFFGQQALFDALKSQTLQRLPDEMARFDRVLTGGDPDQVRRAAHNMKSVTQMLGQVRAADLAQALEDASMQAGVDVWLDLWSNLRAELELWQSEAQSHDASRPDGPEH